VPARYDSVMTNGVNRYVADPVHAWGALTVAVGIWCDRDGPGGRGMPTRPTPVWWPTGGMAAPAAIFVVGLLLLSAIATLPTGIPRGHATLLAIRATGSEIC